MVIHGHLLASRLCSVLSSTRATITANTCLYDSRFLHPKGELVSIRPERLSISPAAWRQTSAPYSIGASRNRLLHTKKRRRLYEQRGNRCMSEQKKPQFSEHRV